MTWIGGSASMGRGMVVDPQYFHRETIHECKAILHRVPLKIQ